MKRDLQELNDAAKKERDEKKARKKKYENEIDECQRYRRLLKNHESYIYSLLKSVEGLEQSYTNTSIDITDKEKYWLRKLVAIIDTVPSDPKDKS